MRLSIGIVFLIGVMVATEVICDPGRAEIAAQVLTWFETIVHRLETGQTLKQHGEFIEAAFDNANALLSLLNVDRSEGSIKTDFRPSPRDDYLHIEQIGVTQNDLDSNQPELQSAIFRLESQKTQLESTINDLQSILNAPQSIKNQFELIRNTLQLRQNELSIVTLELQAKQDKLEATPHVIFVLQAIKNVLQGDFQSARVAINESKSKLECNISVEELEQQYSRFIKYNSSLKTYYDFYPTKPTYVIENTNEQTATIRRWITPESLSELRKKVKTNGLMECVSEIAQALVNYLPDYCLPEGMTFIGRPKLVIDGAKVVAHRIGVILDKIRRSGETITLPLDVELKRDVLKIIRQILKQDFNQAGRVLANSYRDRPESLVPVGDVESFNTFISDIYGNVEASSSVSNS